jgi:hypothetical protein
LPIRFFRANAGTQCPTLVKKRISMHVLRHSLAMDLLQQGVDRSVIALWLGHESRTTPGKSHGDAATENVGVNSKHERDRRYENGTVGENQNSTSKFPSLRTTSTLPTRVPGGQRTHRCLVPGRILFDSMASAAESLRSTCGSERRPPECNKQRWPEATPHVGQGTEDNCSGVRSRILIVIECDKKRRNSVQFGTVLKISPRKLSILPAGCREQGSRTLPG